MFCLYQVSLMYGKVLLEKIEKVIRMVFTYLYCKCYSYFLGGFRWYLPSCKFVQRQKKKKKNSSFSLHLLKSDVTLLLFFFLINKFKIQHHRDILSGCYNLSVEIMQLNEERVREIKNYKPGGIQRVYI